MLIYLHIAKTGGTTMLGYLDRFYNLFHMKSWWAADWIIPPDTECLFSHCPYGVPDNHSPGEHQYMTYLRDPVDRIISHYYHALHQSTHPENLNFFKCSFMELVTSDRYATFDNDMVRIISGRHDIGTLAPKSAVTDSDLERAKENLLTFAAVGTLDTFDEDLDRFAEKFGWTDTTYRRMRTGSHPSAEEIPPDVREAIEQRNRFDKELFRYAKEIKYNAAICDRIA